VRGQQELPSDGHEVLPAGGHEVHRVISSTDAAAGTNGTSRMLADRGIEWYRARVLGHDHRLAGTSVNGAWRTRWQVAQRAFEDARYRLFREYAKTAAVRRRRTT